MRGRPPSCNSQKSLGGGLGGKPFLQIVFPPKKTLMITHIVFFKLKDGTREKVEKAAQVLRGLDGRIGELKGLEVGLDVVRAERSFDIALSWHGSLPSRTSGPTRPTRSTLPWSGT